MRWLALALAVAACTPTEPNTGLSLDVDSIPSYSVLGDAVTEIPIVLMGTGDVHAKCVSTHNSYRTAALVEPGALVFTAGDNAGTDGTAADYVCFNRSWGKFKDRLFLNEGNHEHRIDATSRAYFDYGNGAAVDSGSAGRRGKGYYLREVGKWRVYMLDSERAITEQVNWIQNLPAHTGCELAIWHKSLFVAGGGVNATAGVKPLYRALTASGVDLVVSAHAHIYTRFPHLRYDGVPDRLAPRPIVVGTGGGGLGLRDPLAVIKPEANIPVYGVLKLKLFSNRYEWEFIDISGTVRDEGSDTCH
jgi:Calcineurin-like phosphoesterase